MRTFPLVMRSAQSELRGLNLRSLEITSGVQAIHHLVSLFTSKTPSKLLLITSIEYYQLEVGVEQLFLSASYANLSKLGNSTWVTHLWEFLHLHLLELFLPTLDLLYSSCNNDEIITDLLSSFGWKDETLRLVNQVRLYLKVYFVSNILFPGINKIKRFFVQGETDEATFSEYTWPIVQTNKVSFSAWKQAISDINSSDGTLQQSVMWTNMQNSHRKTNASVNDDHTVICIKRSTREIRHYTADISRSLHRYKRYSISKNFVSSEEIHVDATLTDSIWTVFRRCTLHTLVPPTVEITFERWCKKHVRWKSSDYTMQNLKSKHCTIVVDGSFYPNRPWHISASWFVVADRTIIGAGNFITSTTPDYRSAYTEEMCGCLVALQSIDKFFSSHNDFSQIELCIASNCLGVIHKLEKQAIVVRMSAKLHPIVREFLSLKRQRY